MPAPTTNTANASGTEVRTFGIRDSILMSPIHRGHGQATNQDNPRERCGGHKPAEMLG